MRSRLFQKPLLALGATVVGLLASELVCRLVAPSMVGRGRFFTSSGIEVPLGEIIAFLTRMPEADARQNVNQQKPYGMMVANLKLRMGYKDPLPRWDYFDSNGCIAVDTNSLGLRDEEFPAKKRSGEFRVLALGDSMTYGQGVRLDLVWPQVLEARLRAERSGPVEVINAGFATGPGVNSPDGYDRWVADNGILFDPDVVVVGMCLNDVGAIPMLTYPVVPLEPVLGGWSKLLDRSVQFVRQRQERAVKRDYGPIVQKEVAETLRQLEERATRPDLGPVVQPAAWLGCQRGLRALRDVLAAHKVPLVVVVFPMMSQLEPELYPCRSVHALVADFCAQEGIRTLDLLPEFLGRSESDLWVHPSDQHPNHVGHRIFAERIHAFLKAQGLLGAQ
jgi:lysophospholipase L1-like esterase